MAGVSASADVFRAIADPTRRALLDRLRRADCSVGELATPFRMSQPAVSQHLKVLREAGLVRPRQAGRRRVYRLETRPLEAVLAWAEPYRLVADPSGHLWRLTSQKTGAPSKVRELESKGRKKRWPSREHARKTAR
jgi:DNA-binding transcriptional ArsR family regulator